ncbi:MAG: hypothetical protein JSW54_13515, partial [Fidelibacterota bacterium]
MRALLIIVPLCIVLLGCGSRARDVGPEGEKPTEAEQAAGRAFAELEGGEAVPLPGMAATPAETDLLGEEPAVDAEKIATEARGAAERLDYVVTPGWFLVDTSLVFPASLSPAQARQRALQTARAAGLEQALPAKVSFTSLLSDIMDETGGAAYEKSTWSTFALSSVSGHLVDEKILSTDLQPMDDNAYRYRMVMEARVV